MRTISSTKDNTTARGMLELDLRGQTVEEAIMELDMFVNKSLLSNVSQVTVIHGKGTGALRAAVHKYLQHHSWKWNRGFARRHSGLFASASVRKQFPLGTIWRGRNRRYDSRI